MNDFSPNQKTTIIGWIIGTILVIFLSIQLTSCNVQYDCNRQRTNGAVYEYVNGNCQVYNPNSKD